jgi:hypothetical protein
MADNRAILRLLILLVAVTTGLAMYGGFRLEQTLPGPLVDFVRAQNTTEVSAAQGVVALGVMLSLGMMLAGLIGMWWCRRWARWLFTVGALAQPILTALVGWTNPAALISNAIEAGANTASDMTVGATLVVVWLVMEADFAVSRVS